MHGSESWQLVSNNVVLSPHSDPVFTVYDLTPGTQYNVRITAHNSAGSSVHQYLCATLSTPGDRDHPVLAAGGSLSSETRDWSVWSVGIIVSLGLLLLCGCTYLVHLTVHRVITSKTPSNHHHHQQPQHHQQSQYDQYHEMLQLQHRDQELVNIQLTPAHTAINNEILNKYCEIVKKLIQNI